MYSMNKIVLTVAAFVLLAISVGSGTSEAENPGEVQTSLHDSKLASLELNPLAANNRLVREAARNDKNINKQRKKKNKKRKVKKAGKKKSKGKKVGKKRNKKAKRRGSKKGRGKKGKKTNKSKKGKKAKKNKKSKKAKKNRKRKNTKKTKKGNKARANKKSKKEKKGRKDPEKGKKGKDSSKKDGQAERAKTGKNARICTNPADLEYEKAQDMRFYLNFNRQIKRMMGKYNKAKNDIRKADTLKVFDRVTQALKNVTDSGNSCPGNTIETAAAQKAYNILSNCSVSVPAICGNSGSPKSK